MLVEQRTPDDPGLAALLADAFAELVRRYGAQGRTPLHPEAVCLVAVRDGRAVACGAVQPTGVPGTAEIKRMYVAPAARRGGLARVLLRELERHARAAGHTRLLLATGVENDAAGALYTAEGYAPTASFGKYVSEPFARCFAKDLGAPPA
ncbi:GNAT family N-acetyltransferase [Streptomyces sp. MS19]|uniref:GNAT family N-acetyltransferase n=1 Tax=Streptomyces sp. MS19 TaxID=3385972 RepID=UPI0039A38301